jgi:hypothetical protein
LSRLTGSGEKAWVIGEVTGLKGNEKGRVQWV